MRLYNTLSRRIETFKPGHEPSVSLYSCGPTVYDYPHIGNWATYVRWDVLARVLRAAGYEVNWVMNITDVGHLTSDADDGEDKLEKGAKREGKTAWQVADFYIQDFKRGLQTLNIDLGEAGRLVRATDHLKQQIDLVKILDDKGYLYEIPGDGMYFDTSKVNDYGKLARLDIAGLRAGARIDASQKKQPTDFAVWKFSPKGQKRDMEWDSPWGKGFPGWHLECSAMAMHYLGKTIDIHAGGIDHIPVHHTNEIAQSEAATGRPLARFWLHSNFMLVNDQKIAKSRGNGITLQTVTAKGFSGQDIRTLILQSHYRSEAGFSWQILKAAQNRRKNWQSAASLRWQIQATNRAGNPALRGFSDALLDLLADDLNTPAALALIDKTFDEVIDSGVAKPDLKPLNDALTAIRQLLGIDLFDDDITAGQKLLLAKRAAARAAADWPTSDRLRDELAGQGIGVSDTSAGQRWSRL